MVAKFCRRYPWKLWFSRHRFRLIRGRDYDCLTHAMVQMIRSAAGPRRHNVKVSTSVGNNSDSITVRVTGPRDGSDRAPVKGKRRATRR